MTIKRPLHPPARILSSSDPLAPASGSQRRLTAQSVRRCQQNTCRWSESCPSRTEARSCTRRSNQGAVKAETLDNSMQHLHVKDSSRACGHSHCLLDGTDFTGHAESVVAQSSKANGCTTSQNHLPHSVNCRPEEFKQAR